jgi:hypothetical protein
MEMKQWSEKGNILKLSLDLDTAEVALFAAMLKKMNLSSAALFLGLDGFARSLGEHLLHYRELAERRDTLMGRRDRLRLPAQRFRT